MDDFIGFLGNGRSIICDTYHLMSSPQERGNLDTRVEEYINRFSPLKPVPSRGNPNLGTLDKLQHVIEFTEYFTRHAAKAFLVFTVINVAVYHFTRLFNFIAITYFVSTFFFCMIYLDTLEIAGASQDIKDILAKNARCGCVKFEQSSPLINEGKRREFNNLMIALITHNNVGLAIKRIERLSNSLILTRPIANFPLTQIIKHLKKLETNLTEELFHSGQVLFAK